MGRGDKKTKKGKIAIGTYGKIRPHHPSNPAATTDTKPEETTAKKSKKSAE